MSHNRIQRFRHKLIALCLAAVECSPTSNVSNAAQPPDTSQRTSVLVGHNSYQQKLLAADPGGITAQWSDNVYQVANALISNNQPGSFWVSPGSTYTDQMWTRDTVYTLHGLADANSDAYLQRALPRFPVWAKTTMSSGFCNNSPGTGAPYCPGSPYSNIPWNQTYGPLPTGQIPTAAWSWGNMRWTADDESTMLWAMGLRMANATGQNLTDLTNAYTWMRTLHVGASGYAISSHGGTTSGTLTTSPSCPRSIRACTPSRCTP